MLDYCCKKQCLLEVPQNFVFILLNPLSFLLQNSIIDVVDFVATYFHGDLQQQSPNAKPNAAHKSTVMFLYEQTMLRELLIFTFQRRSVLVSFASVEYELHKLSGGDST